MTAGDHASVGVQDVPCARRRVPGRTANVGSRQLCDIEWSELHARKLSSGDVNSVQHPVIAVAVQARGRDQRGQTLDQLQRCQPQLGTPIGLRLVEALHETHPPIRPRAQPLASASCTCKRGTPCRYSSVGLVQNALRSSLECGFEHRNWTAKPLRGTHIE